jgi:hypothetical protein
MCYAPVRAPSQTLLAGDQSGGAGRRRSAPAIARGQSPDRDESNLVMIPPPELLGIKPPPGDDPTPARRTGGSAGSPASSRSGWRATPAPELARQLGSRQERTERTDLMLGPEFDNDRFASVTDAPESDPRSAESAAAGASRAQPQPPSAGKWRPVRSALPELR